MRPHSLTRAATVLVAAILSSAVAGERIEFPPVGEAQPRSLDAAALQAWYGERLDIKSDAQFVKDIQRAEALITNLLRADVSKQAPLKQDLLALKLPPATLRAVVRPTARSPAS